MKSASVQPRKGERRATYVESLMGGLRLLGLLGLLGRGSHLALLWAISGNLKVW